MHSDIARQAVPRSWSLAEDAEIVTLTIDGRPVQAPSGMLLIEAAERGGIYIPRFCWHNRMQPVAMCRMCLVEVESMRGLPTSCTLPVSDGMVVHTESPTVRKAQDGVLEFLLINHPLDCPVCDRGGECPLQDQTLTFGPGESRFVEEKRHYDKPIPISELVMLDRERCVLCARCTRFSEEISGDPLIDFVERGTTTQVLTFPDEPFRSYFSGNTVQICPVGALTATPYRFRARPWDLQSSESTCTTCSVGCQVVVQSSGNQVIRHLGVDSEPINQSWLCDKGRFGYEYLGDPERIQQPLVREGDQMRGVSWPHALDIIAQRLAAAGSRVGVLGGARLSNESAYTLSRFAREVCGTADIDAQLDDGLPAPVVLGIPHDKRGRIEDLERTRAVVVVGPDLKEEMPVLYLRVRRAATALGAALVEIHPRQTGLSGVASHVVRCRPGEAAATLARLAGPERPDGDLGDAHDAIREGPTLVILGRSNVAEDPEPTAAAAWRLVQALPDARLFPVLRRGNVHGALEAGCTPEMLPGRVPATAPGRGARQILEAAAGGDLDALVLVGVDPLADFPDRALAAQALSGARFVVALDIFLTESTRQAVAVLPVAGYAEQDGTTTNLEGRVLALRARVTAPAGARPDWAVLDDLSARMGHDLGLGSVAAIQAAMVTTMPSWQGLGPSRLGRPPFADGELAGDGPLRYEAPADSPVPTPALDAYGVRVLTGRTLYDSGDMVSRCPSLARLAPERGIFLHPREVDRLGVSDGADVVIRNGRGILTLPTRVDSGTPEGVAFIPFPAAAPLITAGDALTEARLESLQ